jgi:hypothetical protein
VQEEPVSESMTKGISFTQRLDFAQRTKSILNVFSPKHTGEQLSQFA